jgi:polyhydroxyalkanoate synthesis regulator phasin
VPVQDFLITFKADTTGALTAINALATRVKEVDALLNSTLNRGSVAGGRANPLTQAAQAGPGAAKAVNQVAAGFTRMGQGVGVANDRVQGLLEKIKSIRRESANLKTQPNLSEKQIAGIDASSLSRQLNAFRQLESTLAGLQRRGDPVAAQLANVRREVDRLAISSQKANQLSSLLGTRATINRKMEIRGRETGVPGGDRDLIRSAMRNEEALQRIGNKAANAKLDNLRRQFAALPPAISASTRSMLEFNAALQRRVSMGESLKLPNLSAATLTKGLDNGIELMKRGYGEGAQAVEFFGQRVSALPPTLDRAAQGMLNHGRRVAEGLFIYEALGRAMQAVSAQIELVNNLAREQIRFNAVSGGLGAGGSSDFLLGLQDIAVRTNTPMDELASQIDTVGAAMIDNGDAARRMADSQQFLNDAGQFTNITTRDLATETENLLGIYNMAGDGVGEFSDRLGRIVLAGRNSSRIIQGVTDVLSEAGRSARATGFDFDFLASVGGQMVQDLIGTMSGSEIGTMLNTIIGRLVDPQVISKIGDLTDGMIKFSNTDGTLRNTHDILIDIFDAIKTGAIDAETARSVLDQIVPPLNPGARAFVDALQRNIPEALEDMNRIMGGSAEDAKALSDALVSGPGERFAASMKEVQGALTGIFTEEIITAGNTFADMLKTLASLLGSGEAGGGLAGAITSIVVRLTLFGALMAGFSFAWRNISAMLGSSRARMEAIRVALTGMTVATTANTTAAGANAAVTGANAAALSQVGPAAGRGAAGMIALTGAMSAMRSVMSSLLGIAKGLLPILLAMAAIELPETWADTMAAGNIQDQVAGRSRLSGDLLSRGFQVASQPSSVRGIAEAASNTGQDLFGGEELSDNQFNNVVALSEALIILQRDGKLTAASQKALEDQIIGTGGKIKEQAFTAHELVASMDVLVNSTSDGAAAWDGYTEAAGGVPEVLDAVANAEKRASDAMMMNAELSDERAAAMSRLTQQLREGSITVDEWSKGQSNAAAASEAAATFIANYGDQLAQIPGLQERMARTGETAAAALMGLLLENPDTFDQRLGIIDYLNDVAEANAELAAEVEQNPPKFSLETQQLMEDAATVDEVYIRLRKSGALVKREIQENPITPEIALERLRAQAAAALNIYKVMLQASAEYHKRTSSAMQAANPEVGQALRSRVRSQGGDMQALERAIAELDAAGKSLGDAGDELAAGGAAFGALGTIREGDSRLDSASSREPSQTGIIDIGDLPASTISQIVAIASAAQSRVVAAGGVVDDDETTAFFKDAAFQRLVAGVDQRFLQQAIEELTEVEKRRLELESARLQDVTRSTVVQTGPIQSIVSAPVLAAGGGVLTGQGLNADPRLGNFTINVPINWSGMDLATLQRFIYESIAKAYIDAGRGG